MNILRSDSSSMFKSKLNILMDVRLQFSNLAHALKFHNYFMNEENILTEVMAIKIISNNFIMVNKLISHNKVWGLVTVLRFNEVL